MAKFLHVFVCSTYRDLVSERNAVLDGLEWLRSQYPGLSYFCPRNILPLEVCKEEIRRSEVLVLIQGHLQGVIAPGQDMSHGEAEYREGLAQGKKILVYFRDEKVGNFPNHFERDPQRIAQLNVFKEELAKAHGSKTFSDLPSLVNQINEDLTRLCAEKGLEPKPGSKTAPVRTKGWETRKLPTYAGSMDFLPGGSGGGGQGAPSGMGGQDHPTRTNPILQKALSTPFQQRRSSSPRLGKSLAVIIPLVLIAGFALARFHKLPFGRALTLPEAQTQFGASPAESSSVPAAPGLPDEQGAGTVPATTKKDAGSVVLMEDPDTVKTFILSAEDGTPEQQFRVGEMYEEGKEVRRNDSIAMRWFRRAADRGYPEAEYKVALMYRWGKGVLKSSSKAVQWYQSAADHGHAKAQVRLAEMYQSGKGVPKNESMAFKWYLKAADQKDPEAEKILAELKGE